jgi:hypothetical protein
MKKIECNHVVEKMIKHEHSTIKNEEIRVQ